MEPSAPATWWDMSRPIYKWFGSEFQSSNDLKPRLVRDTFFKLTQWGVVFVPSAGEEREEVVENGGTRLFPPLELEICVFS